MIPFSWNNIEPAYRALVSRELRGVRDLERLIYDRSEIDAHVQEVEARAHDRSNAATGNRKAKREFLVFAEQVRPLWDEVSFELDLRIVESSFAAELDPERFGVLLRSLRAAVALYRTENVELAAHESVLAAEYSECVSSQTVDVDGAQMTQPEAAALFEEPDARLRERVWRDAARRRMRDAERMDQTFDRLVEVRTRMARNVGLESYRQYAFLKMERFDYTPADCEAFHAGVEEHLVPLQSGLWQERRAALGTETLRPWDLFVDPGSSEPLAPFEAPDELVEKTQQVVSSIDPELGQLFAGLRDGASLDLVSRAGKALGAYQNTYAQTKGCFILMSAVGQQRDVETLLHESGHAFHALLASDQEPLAHRHPRGEFRELASMTLELFAHPHLGVFYDEDGARRARRAHLERIVCQFPWTARVDAFQHWVYTHPEHDAEARSAKWTELGRRFQPGLDWSGFEEIQGRDWQRVAHLFTRPFYFIEYGIGRLGALRLWEEATALGSGAHAVLERYKDALRLGGSRPLPELFSAAGIELDLGPAALERAARQLRTQLDAPR